MVRIFPSHTPALVASASDEPPLTNTARCGFDTKSDWCLHDSYLGPFQVIAAVGLDRAGTPHVRHLSGPLWEMRLTGRDGISRALYVATKDMRLVERQGDIEGYKSASTGRNRWRCLKMATSHGVPTPHYQADRLLVVVRVFFKKTRRTPRREIELALRRAREMMT